MWYVLYKLINQTVKYVSILFDILWLVASSSPGLGRHFPISSWLMQNYWKWISLKLPWWPDLSVWRTDTVSNLKETCHFIEMPLRCSARFPRRPAIRQASHCSQVARRSDLSCPTLGPHRTTTVHPPCRQSKQRSGQLSRQGEVLHPTRCKFWGIREVSCGKCFAPLWKNWPLGYKRCQ